MCIHTEKSMQEMEKSQPQVNRNENGYDHSQEHIGVSANFDIEELDVKLNDVVKDAINDNGKVSVLMEVLEQNLSTRELAFLAANEVVGKVQKNPFAALMASMMEGEEEE